MGVRGAVPGLSGAAWRRGWSRPRRGRIATPPHPLAGALASVDTHDQRRRHRHQTLVPAREAQAVRRRARHRHRCARRLRKDLLSLVAPLADLRAGADDLDRDVADTEARLAYDPGRLGEEYDTRGARPLRPP